MTVLTMAVSATVFVLIFTFTLAVSAWSVFSPTTRAVLAFCLAMLCALGLVGVAERGWAVEIILVLFAAVPVGILLLLLALLVVKLAQRSHDRRMSDKRRTGSARPRETPEQREIRG